LGTDQISSKLRFGYQLMPRILAKVGERERKARTFIQIKKKVFNNV
jgi:hypothetical protein